jgi:hypothetical protein
MAPQGVGLIAVTCMVGGWKEEAYREALDRVEACSRELGRRFCSNVIHGGAPLVFGAGQRI